MDTSPSHVLAASIIGTFDLLNLELDKEKNTIIDDFITANSKDEFPCFKKLIVRSLK